MSEGYGGGKPKYLPII